MSKTPPFAPETLETIQRSIRFATERRHDTVGLEHLLLAATDEPQAKRILIADYGIYHATLQPTWPVSLPAKEDRRVIPVIAAGGDTPPHTR